MRLLVDEDLASRELPRRLEDVLPKGVLPPDRSTTDEQVWQRAQRESAAILTGNAVDFLALVARSESHNGLLLVYRSNDRRTDLRATAIARGVAAIAARYPDGLGGLILPVNDFARIA